jgi:tripartite-type tricarboxylate transporter receptor subunit TctC
MSHLLRNSLIAATLAALGGAPALASDYPGRPVTIVAPYGAGGSSDTLGRVLAEQMSTLMGGQFVVENRPGAGSRVGIESVARADADGYTMVLVDMPHTIIPSLYPDARYHPVDDFETIAMIGVAPMVLFANPGFKAQSLPEILALAEAEPGEYTIASGGEGSTTHLMSELLQVLGDVELLHVPYGGAGPALQALASGEVNLSFSTVATGAPLLAAGGINPVAVTAAERMAALPDVPTFQELGVDLLVEHWWGLLVPAGTPEAIVEALREAAATALASDALAQRLQALSVLPSTVSPEAAADFIAAETARWARVIEDAGISLDN